MSVFLSLVITLAFSTWRASLFYPLQLFQLPFSSNLQTNNKAAREGGRKTFFGYHNFLDASFGVQITSFIILAHIEERLCFTFP